MTEVELQELLVDCPVLYHMAARGSWTSIKKHGLLSTSSLLDLYKVTGAKRDWIESQRRPENIAIADAELGRAVIRDQKPIDDRGLIRCLEDGLKPQQWYRILNSRVFFWLTRDRLVRLLKAGAYKDKEHDVIELDTAPLVQAYRERITLSHMNSGCTKPMPHPRGLNTFLTIENYPYSYWRSRRKRGERAVELAVTDRVNDVPSFARRVSVMRNADMLKIIWER